MELHWKRYDEAMISEKIFIIDAIDRLLSPIDEIPKEKRCGRKTMPIKDMMLCIAMQQYMNISARRLMSDMYMLYKLGHIKRVPNYNTVQKFYMNDEVTRLLKILIENTAKIFADYESDFAVDSSGFGTHVFERWFNIKSCDDRRRSYKKIHIIVGVKTQIIASVIVTDAGTNDSKMLRPLLMGTVKNFDIKDIVADKSYTSRDNLRLIHSLGGDAYIPFKSNSSEKSRGTMLWNRKIKEYKDDHDLFYDHYNKRQNVESAFSAIKKRFGHRLQSKNGVSQTNEILMRCLLYNLCIVNKAKSGELFDIDLDRCALDIIEMHKRDIEEKT